MSGNIKVADLEEKHCSPGQAGQTWPHAYPYGYQTANPVRYRQY